MMASSMQAMVDHGNTLATKLITRKFLGLLPISFGNSKQPLATPHQPIMKFAFCQVSRELPSENMINVCRLKMSLSFSLLHVINILIVYILREGGEGGEFFSKGVLVP